MANQQFTEGFNHGYVLSEYLPKVSTLLEGSLSSESIYGNGLIHGIRQHLLDKQHNREKILTKLKSRRDKGLDRDR